MSMVSRKRNRLLIWILAAVLVASIGGSYGSQAWAGDPDQTQNSPNPVGQLSLWALLHAIIRTGVLLPPVP